MINAAEIIRNKRYREEALKIGARKVRTRNNKSKAQTKRQSSLNGDFDAPSSDALEGLPALVVLPSGGIF